MFDVKTISLIILLYSSTLSLTLYAAENKSIIKNNVLNRIQAILTLPEEKIEFSIARLAIEKTLYPDININESMQQIDNIVTIIKGMPDFGSTSLERMGAIIRYLYTPGRWNNFQAYQYDLLDPLGKKNPQTKSVANYIKTKLGNCISMPLLVIILAQRLNVKAHLSTAPYHMFVRYTDDNN